MSTIHREHRKKSGTIQWAFPVAVGAPEGFSLSGNLVDRLPFRWKAKLNRALNEHFEGLREDESRRWLKIQEVWLRYEAEAKKLSRGVLPPNATDEDVNEYAETRAAECMGEAGRFRDAKTLRARCDAIARRVRVAPVGEAVEDAPAVARYSDAAWWRRRLREAHGRAIEESAISIGLVQRKSDIYVSNENLARRRQQNARNAAILENTHAVNEDGEVFSLADLAAKSVSNKAIRRGELMLRIRGMEEVANECHHVALFAVVTCPSRMHAVTVAGTQNPKFDGTTPRQAQAWHASNWKKAYTALHNAGIRYYGVRTVEPHHDGTPHWNLLLFFPPGENNANLERVKRTIKRLWLDEHDPLEKGADKHRVRFETIDPDKGSATAYIAKYISKNIDGYAMQEDLFGTPIVEATQRAEAWARTWGIRQFQCMCSASVMVWRELRRVPREAIQGAPEPLVTAWLAAQKFKGEVDHVERDCVVGKRADYADYIRAIGGPRVKRKDAALWLHREPVEGLNRYGEPLPQSPCGVGGKGMGTVDKGGIVGVIRCAIKKVVSSIRRTWTVLSRKAEDVKKAVFAFPRTRVNNCTPPPEHQDRYSWSEFDVDGFEIGSFQT